MAKTRTAVFVVLSLAGSLRQMASRQIATVLNRLSSGGIGEPDVYPVLPLGAAKGELPMGEYSQRLGVTNAIKHPIRRTKVSKSKSKLQARDSLQPGPTLPLHSLAFEPLVWWQGLPVSRTADVVAPNENSPIRNGANTLPISAAFEAAADQEIACIDAVRSPRSPRSLHCPNRSPNLPHSRVPGAERLERRAWLHRANGRLAGSAISRAS